MLRIIGVNVVIGNKHFPQITCCHDYFAKLNKH